MKTDNLVKGNLTTELAQ